MDCRDSFNKTRMRNNNNKRMRTDNTSDHDHAAAEMPTISIPAPPSSLLDARPSSGTTSSSSSAATTDTHTQFATNVVHLSRQEIESIIREIVLWHDVRPEMREGRFSRKYPGFVEAYPKLFYMCCKAVDENKVANIFYFVNMMLNKRDAVLNAGHEAEENTRVVHDALREKYVDPVIAAADAAKEAADAE